MAGEDFIIRIKPEIDRSDLRRFDSEMNAMLSRTAYSGGASANAQVPQLPASATPSALPQEGNMRAIVAQQARLAALVQQQMSVQSRILSQQGPGVLKFQQEAFNRLKSQIQGFDILPKAKQAELARTFNQAFERKVQEFTRALAGIRPQELASKFNTVANKELSSLGVNQPATVVTPVAAAGKIDTGTRNLSDRSARAFEQNIREVEKSTLSASSRSASNEALSRRNEASINRLIAARSREAQAAEASARSIESSRKVSTSTSNTKIFGAVVGPASSQGQPRSSSTSSQRVRYTQEPVTPEVSTPQNRPARYRPTSWSSESPTVNIWGDGPPSGNERPTSGGGSRRRSRRRRTQTQEEVYAVIAPEVDIWGDTPSIPRPPTPPRIPSERPPTPPRISSVDAWGDTPAAPPVASQPSAVSPSRNRRLQAQLERSEARRRLQARIDSVTGVRGLVKNATAEQLTGRGGRWEGLSEGQARQAAATLKKLMVAAPNTELGWAGSLLSLQRGGIVKSVMGLEGAGAVNFGSASQSTTIPVETIGLNQDTAGLPQSELVVNNPPGQQVAGYMTHEFGHSLDNQARASRRARRYARRRDRIVNRYARRASGRWRSTPESRAAVIQSQISAYAATDPRELVAEAVNQTLATDSPSPLAKELYDNVAQETGAPRTPEAIAQLRQAIIGFRSTVSGRTRAGRRRNREGRRGRRDVTPEYSPIIAGNPEDNPPIRFRSRGRVTRGDETSELLTPYAGTGKTAEELTSVSVSRTRTGGRTSGAYDSYDVKGPDGSVESFTGKGAKANALKRAEEIARIELAIIKQKQEELAAQTAKTTQAKKDSKKTTDPAGAGGDGGKQPPSPPSGDFSSDGEEEDKLSAVEQYNKDAAASAKRAEEIAAELPDGEAAIGVDNNGIARALGAYINALEEAADIQTRENKNLSEQIREAAATVALYRRKMQASVDATVGSELAGDQQYIQDVADTRTSKDQLEAEVAKTRSSDPESVQAAADRKIEETRMAASTSEALASPDNIDEIAAERARKAEFDARVKEREMAMREARGLEVPAKYSTKTPTQLAVNAGKDLTRQFDRILSAPISGDQASRLIKGLQAQITELRERAKGIKIESDDVDMVTDIANLNAQLDALEANAGIALEATKLGAGGAGGAGGGSGDGGGGDWKDFLGSDDDGKRRGRSSSSTLSIKDDSPGPNVGPMSRLFNKVRAGDGQTPASFFGSGALSTLKYGAPSMLMYGALDLFKNSMQEAEQFEFAMQKIESQITATFGPNSARLTKEFSNTILDTSINTGIASGEMAELAVNILGAFKNQSIDFGPENGMMSGIESAKKQVEAAGKIALVTGLPLKEVTDGLTAASLAFGTSFERMGDIAVNLEAQTGVQAKEMISFVGDIAPVAVEAGFNPEEIMAFAGQISQRSGRPASALAESLGRVFPTMVNNREKLYEIAISNPDAFDPGFLKSLSEYDVQGQLFGIGDAFSKKNKDGSPALSRNTRSVLVELLGGAREAQNLIPGLQNQGTINNLVKNASESTGDLEERFEKLRTTLTNTFSRLTQQLRTLFTQILDGGLGDVIKDIASGVGLILAGLRPVLEAWVSINKTLDGIPGKLLAVLAIVQLIKKSGLGISLPFFSGVGRGVKSETTEDGRQILTRKVGDDQKVQLSRTTDTSGKTVITGRKLLDSGGSLTMTGADLRREYLVTSGQRPKGFAVDTGRGVGTLYRERIATRAEFGNVTALNKISAGVGASLERFGQRASGVGEVMGRVASRIGGAIVTPGKMGTDAKGNAFYTPSTGLFGATRDNYLANRDLGMSRLGAVGRLPLSGLAGMAALTIGTQLVTDFRTRKGKDWDREMKSAKDMIIDEARPYNANNEVMAGRWAEYREQAGKSRNEMLTDNLRASKGSSDFLEWAGARILGKRTIDEEIGSIIEQRSTNEASTFLDAVQAAPRRKRRAWNEQLKKSRAFGSYDSSYRFAAGKGVSGSGLEYLGTLFDDKGKLKPDDILKQLNKDIGSEDKNTSKGATEILKLVGENRAKLYGPDFTKEIQKKIDAQETHNNGYNKLGEMQQEIEQYTKSYQSGGLGATGFLVKNEAALKTARKTIDQDIKDGIKIDDELIDIEAQRRTAQSEAAQKQYDGMMASNQYLASINALSIDASSKLASNMALQAVGDANLDTAAKFNYAKTYIEAQRTAATQRLSSMSSTQIVAASNSRQAMPESISRALLAGVLNESGVDLQNLDRFTRQQKADTTEYRKGVYQDQLKSSFFGSFYGGGTTNYVNGDPKVGDTFETEGIAGTPVTMVWDGEKFTQNIQIPGAQPVVPDLTLAEAIDAGYQPPKVPAVVPGGGAAAPKPPKDQAPMQFSSSKDMLDRITGAYKAGGKTWKDFQNETALYGIGYQKEIDAKYAEADSEGRDLTKAEEARIEGLKNSIAAGQKIIDGTTEAALKEQQIYEAQQARAEITAKANLATARQGGKNASFAARQRREAAFLNMQVYDGDTSNDTQLAAEFYDSVNAELDANLADRLAPTVSAAARSRNRSWNSEGLQYSLEAARETVRDLEARGAGAAELGAANDQVDALEQELRRSLISEVQQLVTFAVYSKTEDPMANLEAEISALEYAVQNSQGYEQLGYSRQLLDAERRKQELERGQARALINAYSSDNQNNPENQASARIMLATGEVGWLRERGYRDDSQEMINAQAALRAGYAERAAVQNAIRQSGLSLRETEFRAMDDDVNAARASLGRERQLLTYMQQAGYGRKAIADQRGAIINAERQLRDTIIKDKLDEYQYLLDTDKITKSQYIDYLTALKNTLDPATDQFKELEVMIKRLKDDIGSDLQANLPTSLQLPTLYEVRRLDQTGTEAGAAIGGIGYQDNRNVQINVSISDASDDTKSAVIKMLDQYVGADRNGYYQGRY